MSFFPNLNSKTGLYFSSSKTIEIVFSSEIPNPRELPTRYRLAMTFWRNLIKQMMKNSELIYSCLFFAWKNRVWNAHILAKNQSLEIADMTQVAISLVFAARDDQEPHGKKYDGLFWKRDLVGRTEKKTLEKLKCRVAMIDWYRTMMWGFSWFAGKSYVYKLEIKLTHTTITLWRRWLSGQLERRSRIETCVFCVRSAKSSWITCLSLGEAARLEVELLLATINNDIQSSECSALRLLSLAELS